MKAKNNDRFYDTSKYKILCVINILNKLTVSKYIILVMTLLSDFNYLAHKNVQKRDTLKLQNRLFAIMDQI